MYYQQRCLGHLQLLSLLNNLLRFLLAFFFASNNPAFVLSIFLGILGEHSINPKIEQLLFTIFDKT